MRKVQERGNELATVLVSIHSGTIILILMYEAYLRNKGLTKNSTSFYMRILRAVYNRAVEKDLTTNRNPFKHVYTGIKIRHFYEIIIIFPHSLYFSRDNYYICIRL